MRAHDFFLACKAQDWYYSFSDDASVYRRGKESEARLLHIAVHAGGVFPRIMKAWTDHVGEVSRGNKEHPEPKWDTFATVGNPNPEYVPVTPEQKDVVNKAMEDVQCVIPTPSPVVSQCVGDLERINRHYDNLMSVFNSVNGDWGATTAILCADWDTLKMMSALRKNDIIQIRDRMKVSGDTVSVYGASFIRHHDGSYTHFDADNNRIAFDCILRVLVYVAARWH